ncbi:MAG: hypothetical protein Fur0020_01240 [Thermodesulfovibrionia bacterium]
MSSLAYAQDISIHGFLQGNYSINTSYPNPDGGDFKWAEERLQLKIEANREPLRLFLKTDAFYDHIDEEADLEIREGYIDYASSNWDLRIGRQIITWGLGDLLFINDVFPKDYVAFFSGRPIEYLKKGIDGIKIGLYPSFASIEFVIIPFFESDEYPLYPRTADIYPPRVNNGRWWISDPKPAIKRPRRHLIPINNIEDSELALRVYRSILDLDVSLYLYRGYYKRPFLLPDKLFDEGGPTRLDYYHPELSIYGASLQGRALGGVLSLEGAFYDSIQDRDGTQPQVPNSSTRFLIGYQRQVWEDFTIGVQYYMSYMHKYDEHLYNINLRAPSCPPEKEIQDIITIRLTHLLLHQTLRVSTFLLLGLPYGDYMLIPEIRYNLSDHVWTAIGANIFKKGNVGYAPFGGLDKNDNLYFQLRYEF